MGAHTIPHKISPANSVWTFWAVKNRAVQALISIKHTMTVHRYPKRSDTHPLIRRPMSSPTLAP
jgi:hypothetical protein